MMAKAYKNAGQSQHEKREVFLARTQLSVLLDHNLLLAIEFHSQANPTMRHSTFRIFAPAL